MVECRQPLSGAAAYRVLRLTGAFQSTFPAYRQRASFSLLGDASQLTAEEESQRGDAARAVKRRRISELFGVGEDGSVEEVFKADGVSASQTDLAEDAALWAAHFANDAFNNHVANHEHDCTETCVKYAKKKVEAKLQLRSHKVPSCRF